MYQEERATGGGASRPSASPPGTSDNDLRSRRRDAAAQRVTRARAIAALAASLADGIREGDPSAIDGAQRALVPTPVPGPDSRKTGADG